MPKNKRKDDTRILSENFGMEDEDVPSEFDRSSAATVWDHILLNRPLKAVIAMVIAAVVIPTFLYGYMYGVAPTPEPFGSCVILTDYWSECMPGQSPGRSECQLAGCCWNNTAQFCHHTLPARQSYYASNPGEEEAGSQMHLLPRMKLTPLGTPALPLDLQLTARTEWHLTVQLVAAHLTQSEHLESIPLNNSQVRADFKYGEAFWVTLWRKVDPEESLFTTENGPLVASQGFWEWSLQFPSDAAVLGAGSVARKSLILKSGSATFYPSLRGNTNGKPFILCIHQSGRAHGVLFESAGALEVVARPSNLVSLRSAADDALTLHVFTGDSPADVIERLTLYTGRPTLPPYWALGVHVCRDSARNDTHNKTLEFREQALRLDFPYDSDCVDDSALANVSLAVESWRLEALRRDVEALSNDGRHFLLTLFPQVVSSSAAYQAGLERDVFLTAENGSTFLGWHRDAQVAYPDFFTSNTSVWLKEQMNLTFGGASIWPSGVVLSENWPLNEDDTLDDGSNAPIYIPEGLEGWLSNGTVSWLAVHRNSLSHHALHNQYGTMHTRKTIEALRKLLQEKGDERLMALSEVSWLQEGSTEAGYLGEAQPPTWVGFKNALLSVLEAGLSGQALSGGGAICGSRDSWGDILCSRWSLLAMAAFPLVRYHHAWDEPPRDVTYMYESTARVVARAARLRYELMPYLYTYMHVSHVTGMPVLRAMGLEFPGDNATWSLDEQAMVGPAIMVVPVLQPAAVSLSLYLPRPGVPWYHLLGGERVMLQNNTGHVTLLTGENELVMLARGGNIIVMQESAAMTSAKSRLNPFHIIVVLHCMDETSGFNCTAQGQLYLDDGVSLEPEYDLLNLTADASSLLVEVPDPSSFCGSTPFNSTIDSVDVYGMPLNVTEISVNGETSNASFTLDSELYKLQISKLNVDWCILGPLLTIEWL